QEPFSHLAMAMTQNPTRLAEANMKFFSSSMQLYKNMSENYMSMLMPGADAEEKTPSESSVIAPAADDRRFRHDAWEHHPIFKHIRDTYLLTSQWMRELVIETDGLDESTAKKVEFFTERYLDALSPTNFAATNPAVMERLIETKGASLVHGMKNMLEDIEEGEGQLKIRMTDTSAFTLGENIATLAGKVVFENRMFQLIQYNPTTPSVFKKPLLVVPPWINKYYILDLQPKNSYLKWLVDQGHTVFVMSWVNPDETYKEVGFDEYVKEGILAAVEAIIAATGEEKLNAIGYCLGGTLLATTLGYMAANGDQRISSATFLATMIDFEEPGDLGVFIGEEEVSSLEHMMDERGYLDGGEMAGTFNLLRANDLIWSFYINNYLMGNDARPFDLLYWNSDSTRMPACMHSFYLRNMYMQNLLREHGGLEIDGTPIDLAKVTIPVCFVSASDDHIAPWKSTYAGVKLFGGSRRFILGGSGHIAGIVNPPEANKYEYRVTSRPPADPEKWAEKAEVHEGSWWPEWQRWVKGKSGKQVDVRMPGDAGLDTIEDAPGSYVTK
ncbi:MAG: class I poly(R)-hydroxyalkanoic acid synthase, partial [Proteobacteria bacterium]|nr:class I poly(R)-hydroxyalkanoic acid synthase [Pseudomonadota bacterium]